MFPDRLLDISFTFYQNCCPTVFARLGLDFDLTSSLVALDYLYATEGHVYPDFITASWSGSGTFLVTPLPAALPLFATGVAALGLLGWRTKRKSPGRTWKPHHEPAVG